MAGTTDEKPRVDDPAQSDYEDKVDLKKAETDGTFNDIVDNYDKTADDAQENANIEKARQGEVEPTGRWSTNVNNPSRAGRKTGMFINIAKKRGPLAAILLALGLGGIGIGGLTTALGPIMFVETALDDLNDQFAAMDIGATNLFRTKIPTQDRKAFLKGCTALSIRCKFATLSRAQVGKLEKAGFLIIEDESYRNIFGKERVVPKEYRLGGISYDSPEALLKAANTDRTVKKAIQKANRMKFTGFSDKTFLGKVLGRYGISKKPIELKGNKQQRLNAILNKAGTPNAADVEFRNPADGSMRDAKGNTITEFVDSSGKPLSLDDIKAAAADGRQYRVIVTDQATGPPTAYTMEEYNIIRKTRDETIKKSARPPSKVTKASIGALSVLGAYDIACSITHMIGAASVAAKVSNQAETIQYAMGAASQVQRIKSGDPSVTPEDAEAVGDFFTQTDARQFIPDIAGSVNASSSDDSFSVNDTLAMKPNPNYGKSALNSNLSSMSINGGVAPPSETQKQVSLGIGQNQLLGGFDNFADVANQIVNLGSDRAACDIVQSAGVRLIGIIGTVAIAIGSGGAGLPVQLAVMAGMITAMAIVSTIIDGVLSNSVVESADLDSNTVGRGDITWTGLAAMSSVSAQTHGLMPANTDEIVAYSNIRESVNQDYIAIESEDANPLDINDQYSFLGSFARSVLKYTPNGTTTVASSASSLLSFVQGGLLSPLFPQTSAATGTKDPNRFKQCDDDAYQKLGIDPDVQCNVRYVMPDEDLALQPEEVAKWMEDNHYVEKNTTTGFPKGYTPADPEQSQGAVLDFVLGISDGFIEQFINQRAASIADYNDYAKFLDYCAYRTLPYGNTFEDSNGILGASADWVNGEKCRSKSKEMSYFRMYTLYKSVNEGLDDEGLNSTDTTDKQALAQKIVAKGKVTYGGTYGGLDNLQPKLEDIANGTIDPNAEPCGINLNILKLIDKITDSHSIKISDINRQCKKNTVGGKSDPKSRHYAGNGSALDIAAIDGHATNGRDAGARALIEIAIPILTDAADSAGSYAQIGQVNCGAGPKVTAPIRLIKDSCDHLHLDVPGASDPSLKTTPGGW